MQQQSVPSVRCHHHADASKEGNAKSGGDVLWDVLMWCDVSDVCCHALSTWPTAHLQECGRALLEELNGNLAHDKELHGQKGSRQRV